MRPVPSPVPSQRPAADAVPVPAGEVFAVATEYLEAGRLDAADRMLGHVLSAMPNQADALHLKGMILFRRGKIAEAGELMERAIALGGINATNYRNLSEVFRLQARLDDAIVAARRAVTLDPADPLGPFTLAMAHYDRLELDACVSATRHALDMRPNLPQAHMKLAQALLLKGDLGPGWDEYEWRYQIPGAQPLMPKTDKPQWNGGPLQGQRLLLVGDQGFGDVVMFARYIPWVLARCPDVSVACSGEMRPILARMFPGLHLFNRWDEAPPFAAFCPFSGLPRLAGTRLDTIPAEIPYLRADPDRVRAWRQRLDGLVPPGLRRVGIAWAGRPTHSNDHNRSISLDTLAPIAALDGIALVSLQKGPAVAQIAQYQGRAPLVDLDKQLQDFEDTAAILDGLDLLVCVDTAVGHFAGAMGKPAWMMLPYAPDWRWLLNREDSPWYPSLRLFRHPQPRRWDLLVQQVAAELQRLVAGD
nr:tetratricopeptide repeat protein [Limobrevibacterium gyesilva]